jgi:NADH-quinone oxidoreductase subunit M
VLSAAYALWLYRRVIFGPLERPALMGMRDIDSREMTLLLPLVFLVIYFGVYPSPIFDVTTASVNALIADVVKSVGPIATTAVTAGAPAAAH